MAAKIKANTSTSTFFDEMDIPDTSTPRRSRKMFDPIINGEDDDIFLGLLESEKNRSRMKFDENTKTPSTSISITEKSVASVVEHYQNCIKLSTENKITSKNAFSLHLIDYASALLKRKDKHMRDFSAVGCTLDAGVKIFAYRVDGVHSDTIKMAGGLCAGELKKNDADDGAEDGLEHGNEEHIKKSHHKKVIHKAKFTIATNPEQINKKKSDVEFFNNRLRIMNCEVGVMGSSLIDSEKLSLHTDHNKPFWETAKSFQDIVSTSKRCAVDVLNIPNESKICPTFSKFDFQGNVNSEITTKDSIQHKFDLNSSLRNEIDYEFDTGADDIFENDADCNDAASEMSVDDQSSLNTCRSTANFKDKVKTQHCSLDMTKLIMSTQSEYCYLNSQLLLTSMQQIRDIKHWNPFKKQNPIGNKQKPIRKEKKEKNVQTINYHDHAHLDKIFDQSKIPKFKYPNWEKSKLITTPDLQFDINDFFRLNICRGMSIQLKSEVKQDPEDVDHKIGEYNYDDNKDDSQIYDADDVHQDDTSNNVYPSDVHEAFDNDNLVEVPQKVAKMSIKYAMKDKSINIKELKREMWDIMSTYLIQMEMDDSASQTDKELLLFSTICKILMKESKQHEQLSAPILFNAVLQLANDKHLRFEINNSKSGDFKITNPEIS